MVKAYLGFGSINGTFTPYTGLDQQVRSVGFQPSQLLLQSRCNEIKYRLVFSSLQGLFLGLFFWNSPVLLLFQLFVQDPFLLPIGFIHGLDFLVDISYQEDFLFMGHLVG